MKKMHHKILTSEKLKLINIIIEFVKDDINNEVLFFTINSTKFHPIRTLRILRNIVDRRHYNEERQIRLKLLREHYMFKIIPKYEILSIHTKEK